MEHTVLLEDGTVGQVEKEILHDGDRVTITLQDENGLPIEKSGYVREILS